MAEDKVRRRKQREELIAELKSRGLPEAQRKQAQQHLETLLLSTGFVFRFLAPLRDVVT